MFKLQNMRNHKKLRWPLYILFAVVIVSFVFFYGFSSKKSDRRSGPEEFARVRSGRLNPFKQWVSIDRAMLREAQDAVVARRLQMLPSDWAQALAQRRDNSRLAPNDDVIREAANRVMVERTANEMGVVLTFDDVVEGLNNQRPPLTNRQLQEAAWRQGLTEEGFVEKLRRDQIDSRTRALETAMIPVSPYDVWQEFHLARERVTLELVAWDAESFKDAAEPTSTALAAWLEEHRADYHKDAERRYAFVKVAREDLAEDLTPSDEEIETWFTEHGDDYAETPAIRTEDLFSPLPMDGISTEALAALGEARERAAATENWVGLAQEIQSAHPGLSFFSSKSPWIELDAPTRSPLYMTRVQALVGDAVSSPILDTNGIYLTRVIGRREGGAPPLDDVREQVEADWLEQKSAEAFDAEYTRIKEALDAYVEQPEASLAEFAQSLGLDDALSTPVAPSAARIDPIGELTSAQRDYVAQLGFKELSDVLRNEDWLAVLQIVEQTDAYDPALAEVAEAVEADWRLAEGRQRAETVAAEAFEALEADPMADLFELTGVVPTLTRSFTRLDPIAELDDAPLLNFRDDAVGLRVGSVGRSAYGLSSEEADGWAIWRVVGLAPPTRIEFERERAAFERDVAHAQRLTLEREWLADLRRAGQFELIEE